MIVLIRHGQTEANQRRYAGREDVPLNAEGVEQAKALVPQFRQLPIDQILCSPLQRAVQSATPLANDHNIPISLCQQLTELDFGVLQGQPKAHHRLVIRRDHLYTPIQDGECLFDLWQRVGHVSKKLLALNSQGNNLVVVGHYWTNRLLYGRINGCSLEKTARSRVYRPETGSSIVVPS